LLLPDIDRTVIIFYLYLHSTDTIMLYNGERSTQNITLQGSGQRKLDCGQHVDSRPPPSKLS